jgi:hypothetical protein
LARRINRLLNEEGYTVRGVQKLLREKNTGGEVERPVVQTQMSAAEPSTHIGDGNSGDVDVFRLIELRNRLLSALDS